MKKRESMPLRAVYEKDIENFLMQLGFLENINQGVISCKFCARKISKENFGGLIRISGNLEIFCDSIECYMRVLEEKSKHASDS